MSSSSRQYPVGVDQGRAINNVRMGKAKDSCDSPSDGQARNMYIT